MLQYKIKVIMFAGRRNLMKFSIPYVLTSNIVDLLYLCENTRNEIDNIFIKLLEKEYPDKIKIINIPSNKLFDIDKQMDFLRFYSICNEPNTIYIKIDDDLIWMSNNYFETLALNKLKYNDSLFIYPFIINNPVCSYILHINNNLKGFINKFEIFSPYIYQYSIFFLDKYAYVIGKLHEYFLNEFLLKNKPFNILENLKDYYIHNTLFNINTIAWNNNLDICNKETNLFNSDEIIISQIMPMYYGKNNIITTNALAVHYAFGGQYNYLTNETDILKKYEDYYNNIWKNNIYYQTILNIILNIEK